MALGYSIAVIIHRRSIVLGGHEELSVTLDTLEGDSDSLRKKRSGRGSSNLRR
jgi:hypothetical protein